MCDFRIPYDGDASEIVELAQALIEREGGRFDADDSRAEFSIPTPLGPVEGSCRLPEPSTIGVTITRKPMLVSNRAIEERIVSALGAIKAQRNG